MDDNNNNNIIINNNNYNEMNEEDFVNKSITSSSIDVFNSLDILKADDIIYDEESYNVCYELKICGFSDSGSDLDSSFNF
jgi:hypothetical protein